MAGLVQDGGVLLPDLGFDGSFVASLPSPCQIVSANGGDIG
ncbi:MAG: hypothetical protein M5U34_47710 [Chloroflexi bacterium]|nr:hypothetical protein [Chloroflexota bacterium]